MSHRSPHDPPPVPLSCAALPAVVCLLIGTRFLPDLAAGELINPDSYMRLVRLRDIVASHQPLAAAARDGSGHGTILHWSHLLDGLLVLLAQPFAVVMPVDKALHVAGLLSGPLSLALLGYTGAWAAAPFAERRFLWLGAILPALSPAIVSYGLPGVVHHHVLATAAAVAAWGCAGRIVLAAQTSQDIDPIAAGVFLGTVTGAGIWLTPEIVPPVLLAFCGLWLASLDRRQSGPFLLRALASAGLTAFVVTLAAFLADPPAAGPWAPEADRISIVFVGLTAALAAAFLGLLAARRHCPAWGERLSAAFVIPGYCLTAWAWWFKPVLFNPGMVHDRPDWIAFFGVIQEMLPLDSVIAATQFLLTGLSATVIAAELATRLRSPMLAYGAVCSACLLIIGQGHTRFACYPEAVAAVILPVALTLAQRRVRPAPWFSRNATIPAIALVFLAGPFVWNLPSLISSAMAAAPAEPERCKTADAVPMLLDHPGDIVLTEVSEAPYYLYTTGILTVGSLYHRNLAAYLRLRAAWRSPAAETAPAEVLATGAHYILGCAGPTRTPLVADLPFLTLYDQLRTGHPPAWLHPIAQNINSGHVLYEVPR